jgi:uncharacterized protein YkwD
MKKFLKIFLPVALLFVWSVPAFPASVSSWNDALYRKYSCGEFKSFAPANRPIDFGHIDYPLLNAAIFFATSCARVNHGGPPFIHSRALEKTAFIHSKDMVEENFFSHENPYEPQKRSPFQRMASVGVDSEYRAENIALYFGIRYRSGELVIPPHNGDEVFRNPHTRCAIPPHTYNSLAASFVEGLMHSEKHRDNILNPYLRYLGCGAFHFHDRDIYGMDAFKATQDFASDVPN